MRILSAISAIPTQGEPTTVSMRCPDCGQVGTFEGIGVADVMLSAAEAVHVGQRRCSKSDCKAHVFIVRTAEGRLIESYPPEVIDFDTTNVPAKVTEALSEAIACHAHECHVAAAMLVRKTLEALCDDQGATGDNLKTRIAPLGKKVVLPIDLLDGVDELRLLGNDAAHIESREYDTVGRDEVALGIDVTKEVLKGVYQMSALVDRLRALKAQHGTGT
jgi:hypothetical protein